MFDTVATIANLGSLLLIGAPAALAALSFVALFLVHGAFAKALLGAALAFFAAIAIAGAALIWKSRYGDAKDRNWRALLARIPLLRPFRFYDTELNARGAFARHAMSIDENRDDFRVVLWDEDDSTNDVADNGARRMRQRWFAGVHSDIGGSYPEAESRLSDIALGWMVEELKTLPAPPQFTAGRLNLVARIARDVARRAQASPGWFPGKRFGIRRRGKLDPSVVQRVAASSVLRYDETAPYRPEGLRDHPDLSAYSDAAPSSAPAGGPPSMI